MANEDLARTYAQAIFEQAVGRWQKALRAANETIDRAGVETTLDNPAEKFERKKELLNRTLPANTDPEVLNFIYLLTSKNELHLLPEVMAAFDLIAARGPVRELAVITSAIPLKDDERQKLEQKVHAQFGRDIDFEYRVDKALLGGMVVRIGDRVIDGSVQSKLNAMRQKLETAR